jgi:16S rRNA processing protein RimM
MAVVGRPHGVRGLSRVQSYAADPADLPRYSPLVDEHGRRFSLRWQGEGVAELAEIVNGKPVVPNDRSAAERRVNLKLYVERSRLPAPNGDEFYLADLVGLMAVAEDGRDLGRVDAVHDHGGGMFLEIGLLLVPFTRASVPVVDIAAGRLTVAPPAEIPGERPSEAAA